MSNSILSYLIDRVSEINTPIVFSELCLNRIQKRYACTICEQACPQNAISNDKDSKAPSIDMELCDSCHLCSGTCPTQCIVPYRVMIISSEQHNEEVLEITCQYAKVEQAAVCIPCLSSLSWDFYAYLSYKAPLIISAGECGECVMQASKYVEAIDERLRLFWGEEYPDRILKNQDSWEYHEVQPSALSRRDLLGVVSKRSISAIGALLPDDMNKHPEKYAGVFRKLLLNALTIGDSNHGWLTWAIGQGCWGCGVCERICPNNAFKIICQDEKRMLVHDVFLCTNCQICKMLCLEHCIGEQVSCIASQTSHYILNPVSSKSCEICGCSIKLEGPDRCSACKTKQKRKIPIRRLKPLT